LRSSKEKNAELHELIKENKCKKCEIMSKESAKNENKFSQESYHAKIKAM